MKTMLYYIEKTPSVLELCSVTEFYCERHFSAIWRDKLKNLYIYNIYCERYLQQYTVFRNVFIPSVYFLNNLLVYISRLLSMSSLRAPYMVPVLSPHMPGSIPGIGSLEM